MKDLTQIRTIEQLTESLSELKKENVKLTDYYDDSPHRYFENLITSPLMINNTTNPAEVMQAIADTGMSFDITATTTKPLLWYLLGSKILSGHTTKQHTEVAKILVSHFALKATTNVLPGQNIFMLLIEKSAGPRITKTIEALVDLDLIPEGNQEHLPTLPLNLTKDLANKINHDKQLTDIVNLLKNKFNLNGLAAAVLKLNNISTDLALQAFTNGGIKIDFNAVSQTENTILDILMIKLQPFISTSCFMYSINAMVAHNINWSQVAVDLGCRGKNFMTYTFGQCGFQELQSLITVFAQNKIDLTIKDQHNDTALNQIAGRLCNIMYDAMNDNKYLVQELAKADISFEKIFATFKGKVKISDMLSAYKGKDIDFNVVLQTMQHQNATLLSQIFNDIDNKTQFTKVMKHLMKHKNIDWERALFNTHDNDILDTILRHENIQGNIMNLLETFNKNYGFSPIKKLNNVSSLQKVVSSINDTNTAEIIAKIKSLGIELNEGLMCVVLANSKNVSLSDALTLMGGAAQFSESTIETKDLQFIAKFIAKDNDASKASKNLMLLVQLGFNQWQDDFGDGKQFLAAILENCHDMNYIKSVLLTLSEIQNAVKLDFSNKDSSGHDVIDIMTRNIYNIEEITELLLKFNDINWVEVSNKILSCGWLHFPINGPDFLELLKLAKEDIIKIVNGSSLIDKLVSRVESLDEFQDLMQMCKNKFGMDINDKIGTNDDHILTYLPMQHINVPKLLQITQTLQMNINWNAVNKNNAALLATIIEKTNNAHMDANIRHLISYVKDINWNQALDEQANTVPLFIAKSTNNCWELVIDLLKHVDENKKPIFHVNYKNALGERIIDEAKVLYDNGRIDAIKIIQELRDLGSVEPKMLISTKAADKLDLSEERLDHYEPNKINAIKILNMLYQQFPLSEIDITNEINNFKTKNFGEWANTKWHSSTASSNPISITIPQVIDLVIAMDPTDDSRLPHTLNFKKVLASIIKVVSTSNDEMLTDALIHCLSDLHMCEFGKLINLLYVVQDSVIASEQDNYAAQDFTSFLPVLGEMIDAIQEACKDQTSLALFEWYYNISIEPEKWTANATKVQGVINKVFAKSHGYKIESYHFHEGLKTHIITPLTKAIKPRAQIQQKEYDNMQVVVKQWYSLLQSGISATVNDFFVKVAAADNIETIEKLFDGMSFKYELAYGNFISVDVNMIQKHYQAIQKQGAQMGYKFLEMLRASIDLNEESVSFINKELSQQLLAETGATSEQFAQTQNGLLYQHPAQDLENKITIAGESDKYPDDLN